MAKSLPPELQDFYFRFNWDLEKLWALPVERQKIAVADLLWHLDIPIWSCKKGTLACDLYPREVLENPGLHPRHDKRVENCDLSYPLDMMESAGRLVILDGVHRLVKAVMMQQTEIDVRIIPNSMCNLFAE